MINAKFVAQKKGLLLFTITGIKKKYSNRLLIVSQKKRE